MFWSVTLTRTEALQRHALARQGEATPTIPTLATPLDRLAATQHATKPRWVKRAGSCVAGGWKRTVVPYQRERHEPRLHAADRPSTAPPANVCQIRCDDAHAQLGLRKQEEKFPTLDMCSALATRPGSLPMCLFGTESCSTRVRRCQRDFGRRVGVTETT